jgi:hypothetical protein
MAMAVMLKKLGRAFLHPRHALRRCRALVMDAVGRPRVRRVTRLLEQRRDAGPAAPLAGDLAEAIGVVLSYRITQPERVAILTETVETLRRGFRDTGVPIRVVDASDPPYPAQIQPLFARIGVPVSYEAAPLSLCAAYLRMLRATPVRYAYLQLDDAVTVGMGPAYFRAACALLDKYRDLLNVVSIELPVSIDVLAAERAVDIVMFRNADGRDGTGYAFGGGRLRLLWKERVGEYEFGIFENRFYGFYFHNMIVPTRDFANRLEWYMDRVSRTSVHAIELAAADRTMGPCWTHVAICLSRVCMVDLDYAPTPGAVRAPNDRNREVFEALRAGYEPRIRTETVVT